MRALTAAELLDVWEAGQGLSLPARAATLLAASSDLGWDGAADLPIGERDRRGDLVGRAAEEDQAGGRPEAGVVDAQIFDEEPGRIHAQQLGV